MASRNNRKGSSEKKQGSSLVGNGTGSSSAPVDIPQTMNRKFCTKQGTPFEDYLWKNQKGSSGSSSSSVEKNVSSVDDDGFLAALVNYNTQEIRSCPETMSKLKDKLISSNGSTSKDWTQEEDILLQDLLKQYGTISNEIDRYTKVAKDLEKKTIFQEKEKKKSIFDVVWRVMWLNQSKKESRGKEAEPTGSSDSESLFHLSV